MGFLRVEEGWPVIQISLIYISDLFWAWLCRA